MSARVLVLLGVVAAVAIAAALTWAVRRILDGLAWEDDE